MKVVSQSPKPLPHKPGRREAFIYSSCQECGENLPWSAMASDLITPRGFHPVTERFWPELQLTRLDSEGKCQPQKGRLVVMSVFTKNDLSQSSMEDILER